MRSRIEKTFSYWLILLATASALQAPAATAEQPIDSAAAVVVAFETMGLDTLNEQDKNSHLVSVSQEKLADCTTPFISLRRVNDDLRRGSTPNESKRGCLGPATSLSAADTRPRKCLGGPQSRTLSG